jgi:cell division protein FtsZ
MPGLINLDFADIKSVISEMGKAMMGTGEAEGEDRAQRAADMAISNPLLDDVTMKGAKGVLINITGGPDLMLFEVEQAANRIRAEVDADANIIFGNTILAEMEGRIRVSVVATGIDAEQMRLPEKVTPLRSHIKPAAVLKYSEPRPVAAAHPVHAANPVHAQVEALSAELNAAGAVETYILGGHDAPEVEPAQEFAASRYAATETVRTPAEMPLAHPAPEKKSGWGIFGRKKTVPDMRAEPQMAPRSESRAEPRLESRPAPRVVAARPAPEPTPPSGEDLFPDHARDEQFEIPAFLRRSS